VYLVIPSAALQENSVDVASEFWFFFDVRGSRKMVKKAEFIVQFIDGYSFFTCIVLQTARDKSLREEKSAHPKDGRGALVDPSF